MKRLEHQCRKTQLTVHRDMFTYRKNKVNTMCGEAKKTYYKENLSDIRSHAQFYNIANKLLHRRKTIALPNYECAESLASKFANYFDEKIQRICTTLQTPHSFVIDGTVFTNRPDTDCQLSSFGTVTRAEITQLLSKSPSKTCKLNPMPTHFVCGACVRVLERVCVCVCVRVSVRVWMRV